MVVGIGLRSSDCPVWMSQFLAATTLQGLSCREDCDCRTSRAFVSPCGVSFNLFVMDKWFLHWLTGVEGKLTLERFSLVGLEVSVEAERLCRTLSVLKWNSISAWLYLTGNFGGAQSVFLFGLIREKFSDPGTLTDRLDPLVDEQSEDCWWGMETGIW